MTRHRGFVLGAILLFPPGTFFAQNPAPRTSRIIGIVIDSVHKSGLEGAYVMVDGFEWRVAEPGDLDAFVSAHDIIGLEIYKPSEAPLQYRGADDRCVVMLVWTR